MLTNGTESNFDIVICWVSVACLVAESSEIYCRGDACLKRGRVMASSNAVWGIDIGHCALKALCCRSNEDGTLVAEAFDYIEYPKLLTQPDANPEQLIKEAALSIYQKELAYIHQTYNPDLPIKQRFEDYLRASIRFMSEHPQWFLFMKLCCYLPELSADIRSMYEQNSVSMYALCEDGKQAGRGFR